MILLAPLALLAAVAMAGGVGEVWERWWLLPDAQTFLMAAGGGLLLGRLLSRWLEVLDILSHELTHFVMALALLRRPVAISATPTGGETVYRGRGSVLIRLAPYFLPLWALAALALQPLLRSDLRVWGVGAVGLTWGYHLWIMASQIRRHQPDLRVDGLILSVLTVSALSFVTMTLVALAAVGGLDLMGRSLDGSMALLRDLLDLAYRLAGVV